jgi:hypothetical protein
MLKKSLWRGKYKTLKEYYQDKYSSEYYFFDEYQLEIDPDETIDDVNKYSVERQKEEIKKCCKSFTYFCHKYIKILNPGLGLIPFILFKYQNRVIKDLETKRFNLISKFRQGGLTTVSVMYGLWRCLFRTDQQIVFISKSDREAVKAGNDLDRTVEHFPEWLKPTGGKWNDHSKNFPNTGGQFGFFSPDASRGKAVSFLIIDEAAFIPKMDTHWRAVYPVLSTGGSCVVISTVNGIGNWYEEYYKGAKAGKNDFNVIDIDYYEHPFYNNEKWVKAQKMQLGKKGFLQEIMRSFLGTGDTYIPSEIIAELDRDTRECRPIKKTLEKYANGEEEMVGQIETVNGALWIWKEPIPGHDYIVSADVAEGGGDEADNSCCEVIDLNTMEQVAEFYSNCCRPEDFSTVIKHLGLLYNTALVVVEDMGPGGTVISYLKSKFNYENLYYDQKNMAKDKPGIKVGQNRPQILETIQSRLINKTLKINSTRLVNELNTFIYNKTTKKAQAKRGSHDDAVMAMCIGLFVAETLSISNPMTQTGLAFKTQTYDEIKREILSGNLDLFDEDEDEDIFSEKYDNDTAFIVRRKFDAICREFGWSIGWLFLGMNLLV